MKILVDVNVYIDVLTKRTGREESVRVLNLVRNSPDVAGQASALTVPLLSFFRLRITGARQAHADVQASVHGLRLVPLSEEIISKALASALPDFEDNIQLSILTPEEWLLVAAVAQIEADLQR